MCAGECKYHVLGQEQGLAVGFMLLKVPVCHLDCCLNLEQWKVFASYKWSPFCGSRQRMGRTDVGGVLAVPSLSLEFCIEGRWGGFVLWKNEWKMWGHEDVTKDSKEKKYVCALACHLKTPGGSSLPKSLYRCYFRRVKVLTWWKRSIIFFSKAETSCELFGRKTVYQWCPSPKCYKATQ